MGLLNRAQTWLAATMPAAASPAGPVTYRRKADAQVLQLAGVAWVGNTAFRRVAKEGGAAVVWGDRDYLIPVAALPFQPARGDVITETIGGVAVEFEVKAPLGEPEARYSDPQRTIWRVHCLEL